ncbi:hypothetical protein K502DRAFT_353166 [Neoconidiobolus thromboides FSU 785]|nr:hypothetical protein K502DRAFT_353166 [Neoconidiobolus thromboides FSU 785]
MKFLYAIVLLATFTLAQDYGYGKRCKDVTKVVTSTTATYVTKTVQGSFSTFYLFILCEFFSALG